MSDLRSSFRYGLPHRFWPSASETGIVPTRHEQHQRSAQQREQVQLRTLLGSIRSGPRPKEAPAPVAVEGWRNFPGLPVGPRLEQREAKVREPSMREAAQQLSFGWRSRYHQDPISAPKRPQSANQKAPSTSRFAKMFDPKQLPADFRQQLCNLPRPIAARAFKHHLCITGVEGELSEDLGEAPQTPPNTPSHVEPPEAVRRSGKKRPSEGKPEGSPSASPSWIQRHMRIPSLTSEISEASAVETRRSSTVMQEEEIPGYLVEMQEEEIPGYLVEMQEEEIPGYLVEMQEEEIPGGEESSSSAADADADASPSGPSAFAAAAETSEYEVLQRHQAPPKVHWLEQQELRIRQQLRHSCFDWSERMERMPRQAGGMVTRNWLNRNRKTAGPQWG